MFTASCFISELLQLIRPLADGLSRHLDQLQACFGLGGRKDIFDVATCILHIELWAVFEPNLTKGDSEGLYDYREFSGHPVLGPSWPSLTQGL